MKKLVTLKLVSVSYGGTSIGDDIRIEIETLNALVGFNKRIKQGTTSMFNKEIEQSTYDQPSLEMSMNIRVIERDLVFNDFSSVEAMLRADLSGASPQKSTHRVAVKESRGYTSSKTAQFDVALEVVVTEAVQYVADEGQGWVEVKLEGVADSVSLPAYLKVQLYKTDSKREYFTVMEGALQKKKGSVKRKEDGTSYFMTGIPYTNSVQLAYSISKKMLRLQEKSYFTTDYADSRWEKGVYDIEIPDYPHGGGQLYQEAPHALTWFRVGHSGDRYIHTGSASLGCITLVEKEKWEEIYQVLIKARKGDSRSVGVLEVVE